MRLGVIHIAIVKPIKVRIGNLAGLRAVINYVKDDEKTYNGRLVYMSGGMVGREFDDMVLTKKIFGKTTGRQYAHFVQSFHADDKLTPEIAFQIGREYIASLKQWTDFQVLMAVHTNSENIHIHYIINSVNLRDGSKWQCSKRDLYHFREQSDELCRRYNLRVIENGNRAHKSYGEYVAYKQGVSWKQRLAADIADCIEQATSRAGFHHLLSERGIEADIGKTSTLFTLIPETYGLAKEMKCGDKKLRAYGDFSAKALEKHFSDMPVIQRMMKNLNNDSNLLLDAL